MNELAQEIIGNFKTNLGVDLLPILQDESLSFAARRRRATVALVDALASRAAQSADAAEWQDEGNSAAFLRADAETVDVEPNIVVSEANAKTLEGFQGTQIYDYMYSLTKRMENMANTTSEGELALQIVGGGMISIGVPMAVGTIRAYRAGQTLLAAVRTGIRSIGMKTAIVTITFVLVAFLLWLILENPKQMLGMVLNDTDNNLEVTNWRQGISGGSGSNLYMKHGTMEAFPADYENGNLNKVIQINARAYFGPDDPDNAVYAGIYFANKNAGLLGAEGTMIFSSNNGSLQFAHEFAVPYSNDNGVNIALYDGSVSIQTLNDTLYDTRQVRVVKSQGGFSMTATANDARGGVVASISSITQL